MTGRTVHLTALLGLGCAGGSGTGSVSLSPTGWPAGEDARYLGPLQDTVRTTAGVATGRRGAVTVAYGAYAARAGLYALERGGNAIDAALTAALTQVALTAGAPISYFGIMSLVYYDAKSGQVVTMNADWNTVAGETDPMTIPGSIALGSDKMLGTEPSGRTALVGGFMKGVEAAHRRYGRLPFASLFDPAIHVAEQGMPVTRALAAWFDMRGSDLKRLPATRAVFFKPDGSAYRVGEIFRQPALAATLRQVAAKGADYMYRGPWGERLVAAVQADGGHMTAADLAAYDVIWAPPITGRVGRFEIATLPPPNYGGIGLIEAQYLAAAAGLPAKGHWTRSGEALAAAVTATQAWMVSLLPEQVTAQLYPGLDLSDSARLVPENAARFWERLAAGKLVTRWAEEGPKHSDDVVVVDQDGNMAAITQSINCVVWGKTAINVDGISIGDPASFQQAMIRKVGPGKRLGDPTETGILLDGGRPVLAFASMGSGLHQRTFQGLLNFAVYGMTVDQAIDTADFFLPSMKPDGGGSVVAVPEGRFPKEVLDGMGIPYVEVGGANARFGGEGVWVAISRDPETGELRAASHNRSNSAALAF